MGLSGVVCPSSFASSPSELWCFLRSEAGSERLYAGGVGALFSWLVFMIVLFVASCRLWLLVNSTVGASLRLSSSRFRASFSLLWFMPLLGCVSRFHCSIFSIDTGEGSSRLGSWLLVLKGHIWRGRARESFTSRCLHLV